MVVELDLDALAQEMKVAQDSVQQVQPFTSRFRDFDLSKAYRVANCTSCKVRRRNENHGPEDWVHQS